MALSHTTNGLAENVTVQHFLLKKYPNLAKVYPTNKLPDLRGEFIRGWDDGRGVDNA